MSLSIAHTLYCDTPGCRTQIILTDTGTAQAARTVAHRQHGWSTRGGDHCPTHNPRKDGAE